MAKDDKAVAIGAVEEFFSQLEVEGKTTVEVEGDIVSVLLDTKESGIVIGYHGEILESLEVILSLIISRKLGRFIRVSVEVGDYKKNRSAYLENLALQMKEQALQDKREYTIPHLKSWERRIIHLFLQNDEEVVSQSSGEGRERVLVIRPR